MNLFCESNCDNLTFTVVGHEVNLDIKRPFEYNQFCTTGVAIKIKYKRENQYSEENNFQIQ